MTALAQGSAGVALVMAFALLRTGQIGGAAILLAVQSGAVAVTAVVLHQPVMALPPLILAAVFWLLRRETPMFHADTAPIGGPKLGLCVGAVLAVLCQSQAGIALPLSIVLLAILLAATRSHPLMQIAALIGAQNGVSLAGSLMMPPMMLTVASLQAALVLPLACVLLPLPLGAGLLAPALAASRDRPMPRRTSWRSSLPPHIAGWIDLAVALAIFAATLSVPLDPLASVFAPLFGFDGVIRSWVQRSRPGLSPLRRGAVRLQSAFTILAVCVPDPSPAWLAVLAATAMAVWPGMSRRWSHAVLVFLAAGLCLFGLLLLQEAPSVLPWFCVFAGFATLAASVPELAAALAILILRLGIQDSWPPGVATMGVSMASAALLTCAVLLATPGRTHRITLLVLSHASIAVLLICTGQAEARFAALVLLALLILARSAVRVTHGPVAALAIAGLGGVPPLGVFPGLVLAVLTLSAHDPWLLLPVGAALIAMVMTGMPRSLPDIGAIKALPSVGWLPMLLAIATGWFAPASLVHWWRILTAGRT
jgi:hypothetical protein